MLGPRALFPTCRQQLFQPFPLLGVGPFGSGEAAFLRSLCGGAAQRDTAPRGALCGVPPLVNKVWAAHTSTGNPQRGKGRCLRASALGVVIGVLRPRQGKEDRPAAAAALLHSLLVVLPLNGV